MKAQFRFTDLDASHDRSSFSCEHASLTRFLRERALRDMRHQLSVTRVALDIGSETIVGYHTLAASAIPAHDVPDELRAKLKLSRYHEWSAVLIGRLARDTRWKGQGLGELLLMDAIRRIVSTTASVGAAFIIVNAIDESAASFYQRYGFRPYRDTPLKLFLPTSAAVPLVP